MKNVTMMVGMDVAMMRGMVKNATMMMVGMDVIMMRGVMMNATMMMVGMDVARQHIVGSFNFK